MRLVCTSNCPLRTQSIVSPKELLPGLFLGRTEGDSSTLLLIVIIWFKVNAGGKWTLNYTRKRRNKNWDKSSTPGASRSADSSNQVISLRSVIYTRRVYKSLLFWCRQIEADKKLCLGHHVNWILLPSFSFKVLGISQTIDQDHHFIMKVSLNWLVTFFQK